MKALAISYFGMEDITSLEIKELIGKEASVEESCCVFDASYFELAKYTYLSQGTNRVLILLDSFKIKDVSDLSRISNIDFSFWLKERTFAARTLIIDNEIDSAEVERSTGDQIEGKVDLKNPDVTVFIFIFKDNCYIGIDFSGDISKRDYKINTTKGDLKGTIAYALVRLSDYNSSKSFLNLNAKTGTIAIEAALFGSGFSINYYNKQKFSFLNFFSIDLKQFDSSKKEVKVYAYDSQGYKKVIEGNVSVAAAEVIYDKKKSDCVVDYFKGKAKIKNLEKEREIKYGKEVLKIASQ